MLWFILCYVNFVYSISNVLFLNDFDYKNRKFFVTKQSSLSFAKNCLFLQSDSNFRTL